MERPKLKMMTEVCKTCGAEIQRGVIVSPGSDSYRPFVECSAHGNVAHPPEIETTYATKSEDEVA